MSQNFFSLRSYLEKFGNKRFYLVVTARYQKARDLLIHLEKDPFIRLIITTLFLLTAYQVWVDIDDRRDERAARNEERAARQEERVARAWSILTTKASGNSGKADAIETLFKAGISLEGIDLSCETMGGGWDEKTLNCERPVTLAGMDLRTQASRDTVFRQKNQSAPSRLDTIWRRGCISKQVKQPFNPGLFGLGNANNPSETPPHFRSKERNEVLRRGVNFTNAKLSGVDFSGAKISGASFKNADLRGANFTGVVAEAVNFKDARLQGALFLNSYLSGSIFQNNFSSCELIKNITIPNSSGPRSPICRFDEPKKKIVIQDSYLNGIILEVETMEAFYIFGSEIKNSIFSYNRYKFGKDLKSDVFGKPGANTLLFNDFTCSVFYNDQDIELSNSNISNALFPVRYKKPDNFIIPGGKVLRYEKERAVARRKWSKGNYYWAPWAWADSPPIGTLSEETVAKCYQDNPSKPDHGAAIKGRAPEYCGLASSEMHVFTKDQSWSLLGREIPERETFQLSEPIEITEKDLEEKKFAPEVFSSPSDTNSEQVH